MLSAALSEAQPTPLTNRGVYPHSGWTESAVDYVRATVCASVEGVLLELQRAFEDQGRPVARETGGAVKHYRQHVALTDRLGHVVTDVFWGGQSPHPNVEAKGSFAPLVTRVLRQHWEHRPSRIDVKRDATRPGLFLELRQLALAYSERGRLSFREIANHDLDKGDTLYLGSRHSQVVLRIYQPGLKRAQEEGRIGEMISSDEREAVRVELEFKPQKSRAKLAAASLSPDEIWGVTEWTAAFAGEVFAMNVQQISISERRESNRNRALRFMTSQYRGHLADLLRECNGDVALFGAIILDLADVPHAN